MGDEKRALAPTALTQFIFFLVGKALKKWKLRIGRSVPADLFRDVSSPFPSPQAGQDPVSLRASVYPNEKC